MEVTIDANELYALIKQAVKEGIHEEMFEMFQQNIPFVSEEEMNEIVTQHGNPPSKKDVAYSEIIEI